MPSTTGAKRKRHSAPRFLFQYCDRLVDFMGRGYSLTAFAGEIGVSRADLDHWRERYVSFAHAVERGQARRARLLEDHLLQAKGPAAFAAQMEALKTVAADERRPDGATGAPGKPSGRPASPLATVNLPDNGRD